METPLADDPTRESLRWLIGRGQTPFARLATVFANTYKLSLMWELERGPKRFKQLERALAPVTAKVLTRNLRDLQSMSLIERESFDENPPKVEYRLSPLGASLRPHIVALCHWAYENQDRLTAPEDE